MARQITEQDVQRLASIERRLQQRWHAMVTAEQRGQPRPVLERMYAAYVRDLDAAIACQRALGDHPLTTRLAS